MNQELDSKLVKNFPLLYGDRYGDIRSTAMCWGFSCGDGWFDIIWNLSSKLEPLINNIIKENPNLSCDVCGCAKDKHYASLTKSPGKCLSIHTIPGSTEPPPANYRACWCEKYQGAYPRAAQVKEKFGTLRFYMTRYTDEIRELISSAETLSSVTCEECGSPGEEKGGGWIRTLCNPCAKELNYE